MRLVKISGIIAGIWVRSRSGWECKFRLFGERFRDTWKTIEFSEAIQLTPRTWWTSFFAAETSSPPKSQPLTLKPPFDSIRSALWVTFFATSKLGTLSTMSSTYDDSMIKSAAWGLMWRNSYAVLSFASMEIQYIPRNMHTVLLCFALLWLSNRS